MTSSNASRRLFLRQAGALSFLGSSAAPFALNLAAMGSAAAMSGGDYKALVCVYLSGGNDAYNTVLATDTTSWNNYTAVRNQAPESIALLSPGVAPNPGAAAGSPARLGGVLPIAPTNPQGRSFALHPQLASLQSMFNNDRRLAIVANVGPLVMPTTKAQYASITHPRPPRLFSHNDQQSNWQSFASEGSTRGWGGRMVDLLASMNSNATFSAISAGGNAVWLSGQTVRQYQVNTNGAILYGVDTGGSLYGSHDIGARAATHRKPPDDKPSVRTGLRGAHSAIDGRRAGDAQCVEAGQQLDLGNAGVGHLRPECRSQAAIHQSDLWPRDGEPACQAIAGRGAHDRRKRRVRYRRTAAGILRRHRWFRHPQRARTRATPN